MEAVSAVNDEQRRGKESGILLYVEEIGRDDNAKRTKACILTASRLCDKEYMEGRAFGNHTDFRQLCIQYVLGRQGHVLQATGLDD